MSKTLSPQVLRARTRPRLRRATGSGDRHQPLLRAQQGSVPRRPRRPRFALAHDTLIHRPQATDA